MLPILIKHSETLCSKETYLHFRVTEPPKFRGTWNLLFPSHISPPLPHEVLLSCGMQVEWSLENAFLDSVSHPGPSWCLGPGHSLMRGRGPSRALCGVWRHLWILLAGCRQHAYPCCVKHDVCRQYQNPLRAGVGASGWESPFEDVPSPWEDDLLCISLHTCCLFRFSFHLATSPMPSHHPGLRMLITYQSALIFSSSNIHFTFRLLRNTSFLYGSPIQSV